MNCRNARIFACAVASLVFASIEPASAQIVALGHSAVHGNVSESEMWPAVLEGLLRAKGSQVTVTNAGVWGETTDRTLARVPSAVPQGTRTVILADNPANDVRHNMSPVQAMANIAAIKSQLKARGIRVVDAMPIVISVSRQPAASVPTGVI
jgi:acyl-CoA thioesterase-1